MSKLLRIRGKELIAAIRRAGFQVVRVKGSHHYLSHPDGRVAIIPVHAGETIGPGLRSADNLASYKGTTSCGKQTWEELRLVIVR